MRLIRGKRYFFEGLRRFIDLLTADHHVYSARLTCQRIVVEVDGLKVRQARKADGQALSKCTSISRKEVRYLGSPEE